MFHFTIMFLEFNQRKFIGSGGFTTLFQLLTKDDNKCAKFSRCIRLVLLNCIHTAKASGMMWL